MKKIVLNMYNGLPKTKAAICLSVALIYSALTVFSGGRIAELLLFALVLAGYILLPGLFWADTLKSERFAPGFRAPLCLLFGGGFFSAVYCFSMRLHILWLLWLLPPALGACWLVMRLREGGIPTKLKKRVTAPRPHQWLLILLFAALLLFFSFYTVAKSGHPLSVGNVLLNQDLLWNVGNANSFKLAFPPEDIRFSGVRLQYHYLTELLCGALSIISGISAYNITAFYFGPFLLAGLVLCLYSFARVMWPKNLLKSMFFTYAAFLFSCASLWRILPNGRSVFNNSSITHLITNINGMSTGIMTLCVFMGLLVPAMRHKYKVSIPHYLSLACSFFLLIFAKGPIAAIVVCSLMITLIIGIFQKTATLRGLAFGILLAAFFAVIYTAMFSSGANNSMQLSYSGTLVRSYFNGIQDFFWNHNYYVWLGAVPLLWLLQSFLSLPAQFALYTRGLAADVRHFGHIPQERLLCHGAVAGGLLAYYLFDHPHFSQVYFLFTALFFVGIIAVDSLDFLRIKAKKGYAKLVLHRGFVVLVAICAAVGLATTGFLYVHYMGSGMRQVAGNIGLIEKYPYVPVATYDDEAAMIWLKQNSPQDAMFATNRIHSSTNREGISNLYSAFCERQGYMEGFQYVKTNMGVAADIIAHRISVNTALFSPQTPETEISKLCAENGISYLVYSTQMDGSNIQLSAFEMVFSSPTVYIYAVLP